MSGAAEFSRVGPPHRRGAGRNVLATVEAAVWVKPALTGTTVVTKVTTR